MYVGVLLGVVGVCITALFAAVLPKVPTFDALLVAVIFFMAAVLLLGFA